MPDWITHMVFGWLAAKILRLDAKLTSLLIIGCLIPDYIMKTYLIWGRILDRNEVLNFLMPTHTLFGAFFLGVFLAGFFPTKYFKKAVALFTFGLLSHLFFDGLQTHLGPTMPFLYPLSTKVMGYPVIWSEDPYPLFLSTGVFIIVYLFESRIKGRVKWRRARGATS